MYSSELMNVRDNDAEKKGDESDETADDVKLYIRHNAGGIVKDFCEEQEKNL